MAKITLKDGRIFEGTIEELVELLVKVDGLVADNGDNFRKVEGREPRVGDYVKFFKDNLDITAGKYYEIISFDDDGDPEFIDDGGDVYYAFLDYLGEKFELFEKVGGEETLKVGDYVVPLESADDEYGVTTTEMKLGKVVEGDVDCCDDIRIEVIAHEKAIEVGESYSVNSKHFRKATDEEVAQAKAEQKWAKIGRKPGEFKKGDVVRVVNSNTSSLIGTLAEVDYVDVKLGMLCAKRRPSSLLRLVEYYHGFDDVELIAPVESRVDIDD
jgi:hypothetical protein